MMRLFHLFLGLACISYAEAQFGPHQLFQPEVGTPWCVSAADLDGDGDQDVLAALITEGRIVWFANDGGGDFSGPFVVNASAQYAKFVEAADLDGDGDMDVVAGYGWPAVFAWHSNDGTGNFGPAQVIHAAGGSPYALEIGDIDGDGDLDVATSAQVGGLAWHANMGGGTWVETVVDTTIAPSDISLGDLDGDGDLDLLLAASGSSTVHWRANLGGGVFGAAQAISTLAANGIDVEAVDLDGDGDLDAAYITNWSNGLGWYENLGGGSFGAAHELSTTLSLPNWLHAEDVDQDGLMDLLVTVKWNNQVQYWRSTGGGNFAAPVILTNEARGAFCVASADLDGDGTRDVLFCSEGDNTIGWCAQATPNTFSTPRLLTWSLDGPIDIQLVDLDGDGDRDPVSSSWTDGTVAWFPNDGAGNLSGPVLLARDHPAPASLVFSDLDGDGDLDIAVGFHEGVLGWYANDGAAQFGSLQVVSNVDTVLVSIAVADLNGDGMPDLVSASQLEPGAVAWYAATAPGVFSAQQVIESALGFVAVACADVDGDGDQDIVGTQSPDKLFWYANDGSGNFGPRTVIASNVNQAYYFGLEDLDGDADVDIMVVRQPVIVFDGGAPVDTLPRVIWYANDGAGNFGAEQAVADYPATTRMHLLDIDGDGDMDAALAMTNGPVVVHLNDGVGGFAATTELPIPISALGGLGSGDVDGDGDMDLFTTSFTNDQLGWYENYFGSPYRVQGRVFLDLDGDGAYGTGDTTSIALAVTTTPHVSTAFTDGTGAYTFYLEAGTYDVNAIAPNTMWQLSTTPGTIIVDLTALDPVNTGNDFGFAPIADTTLLVPSVTLGTGVCGGQIPVWLTVRNEGTRVEQGIVRLDLDPAYVNINAVPTPDSIIGSSLYWSLNGLGYFAQLSIEVWVQQPSFTMMGDTLASLLTVLRTDGTGLVTHSFTDDVNDVLACSYDPNDKQVEPVGYGVHGAVPVDTEWLTYTIRFQNTGTATAQDVMVRDQLDADLDPGSLRIVATSHPLTEARVEADGEAVFHFKDILLPDSTSDLMDSQGFVCFQIRTGNDAQHLTTFHNTAMIFFDLNPPVQTNTTITTLVDCAAWEPVITEPVANTLQATEGDGYQWYMDGQPIPGGTSRWIVGAEPGSYTVEVTSGFGCKVFSAPHQVITSGIVDPGAMRIAVFPVPATELVRIVFDAPLSASDHITLVNTDGRVARTLYGDGLRDLLLERNGLASGLYVVRVVRAGSQRGSARLVFE